MVGNISIHGALHTQLHQREMIGSRNDKCDIVLIGERTRAAGGELTVTTEQVSRNRYTELMLSLHRIIQSVKRAMQATSASPEPTTPPVSHHPVTFYSRSVLSVPKHPQSGSPTQTSKSSPIPIQAAPEPSFPSAPSAPKYPIRRIRRPS